MHPERELKNQTPIAQSIGQLALACLNALIEMYSPLRFVAGQEWKLLSGLCQVPAKKVIHMPNPGDSVSLLISEQQATQFREMNFRVIIPPDAIFNLIYNYSSLDDFMGARIEGRSFNGRGEDNGRLHCTKWRAWSISGHYTTSSEPNPDKREHTVRVILDPARDFAVIVDNVQLDLSSGVHWGFDPQGKIGFLTERGVVSILDLTIQN
jgi:hypothetical protein